MNVDKSLGQERTVGHAADGPAPSLVPGSNFGQYRIVRLLGRGGMGEVYEAEHRVLKRRFALKLLPPDFATRPGALDRFGREAEVMANLEHPHIVRVDDFGETSGRYWLRMELMSGIAQGKMRAASLQQLADLRDGRIPQDELLPILREVLDGLAYAHGRGAIHRDIKPSNILLGPGENGPRAKISDFGLVRLVGEEWIRTQAEASVRLSLSLGELQTAGEAAKGPSTRSLLGTYEYMSPEQKRGEESDERSDIYAVGLMGFRLLTGRLPGLRRPSELDRGIEETWDDFVLAALEEDPSDRPADCRAMIELLGAVALDRDSRRSPSTPTSARGAARPPSRETARPPAATRAGATCFPDLRSSWENSLGMKFAPVEGLDGVLFCVWETRVEDYETYARAEGREWEKPFFEQGPTHPAVNVSWEDAKAFCEWLTKTEREKGLIGSTQSYRLPRDLEWSVAVGLNEPKAGTPREKSAKTPDVYPWGTQWPPPKGAGNYAPSLSVDSFSVTSPVGSFAENRHGLFDLGGNVWEWCDDWYDPKQECRVLRGGSWCNDYPRVLLSSYRYFDRPGYRGDDYGFRVVLSGPSSP